MASKPAERAADRGRHRHVGVHGVPREQQPGGLAAEELLTHPLRGEGEEAGEPQRSPAPDPRQKLHRAAHGWERAEQRPQEGLFDVVPLAAQLQPRQPISRMGSTQPGGGAFPVRVQNGRLCMVGPQRVGEHTRRPGPAQAMALELERAQDRGDLRERVERAVEVGGEARVDLGGPDRARPCRHDRPRCVTAFTAAVSATAARTLRITSPRTTPAHPASFARNPALRSGAACVVSVPDRQVSPVVRSAAGSEPSCNFRGHGRRGEQQPPSLRTGRRSSSRSTAPKKTAVDQGDRDLVPRGPVAGDE